ncbi:MAG: hybrid sensor histidine kinase/response regulator [Xenococcaceae cyanobacterium]
MHKILIIEDENTIRENMAEIVRAEGFTAIEAENGLIGLQLALEELPNLILCDVMMPEMDGYNVLGEIRTHSQTQLTPFIFLTAKSTRADLRLGMDLGADDYLMKPFTRDELLSAITTRLAKQITVENDTQKKLENLRSSLTRSLPREFGNPLNQILSLSRLTIEEFEDLERDEIISMLEQVYEAGEVLYRLTRNVLLYSELLRIGTNPERVLALRNSRDESNTKSVISEVAFQKAQQVDRISDLQLKLQEANIPISRSKIKKIAEEIIDNAFKFSKPKTPIQITTYCQNDVFHLFAIDRGQGMTPEQIANLGAYLQFEQSSEQPGFGLGLTIAKLLIELHAGNLSIESILGQHTAIHVTFPTKLE